MMILGWLRERLTEIMEDPKDVDCGGGLSSKRLRQCLLTRTSVLYAAVRKCSYAWQFLSTSEEGWPRTELAGTG